MLKNLKKAAAIVLSFAMAVQFGLADSYYVNAVEEPVEPQQEETKTTTTTPQEQEQEEVPTTEEETPQQQEEGQQQPAVEEEQPAAEEAQPQPQPVEQAEVKVSYVKEDDTDLMESVTATYDVGYRLDQDTNVFKEAHEAFEFEYAFVNGNKENKITKDQVKASGLKVTSDMTSLTLVYKEKASTEKPKKANKQEPAKTETTSESDDASDADTKAAETQLQEFYITSAKSLITKGESVQLTAHFRPSDYANKNVTWESENPDVATVDETGKVTSITEGTVTIKATAQGNADFTDTITITVDPIKVTSIEITGNTAEYLLPGNTVQLSATSKPDNADDKTIVWESVTPEVATVDQNGLVKAVKQGTTIIRAKNEVSGAFSEVKITVYDNKPVVVTVNVWVTNQNQNKSYTFNIPQDGTEVTPSQVARDTNNGQRDLVTSAEFRVGNFGSNANWSDIQKNKKVAAFRYKSGVQYKLEGETSWNTLGSKKIYDFCGIKYTASGNQVADTDVKVTIGDWPYGKGENTNETNNTITIKVLNKDENNDEVYNSGLLRFSKYQTAELGKINFNCNESKYKVTTVTVVKNGKESTKVTYNEGNIPADLSVQFNGSSQNSNYVVTAYITAKTINVKYVSDGETTNMPKDTTTKTTGNVTVDETIPVREGYIFTGWAYSDGNATTLYQGGATFVAPIHDVELKAQWVKTSEQINYKVNDAKMGSVSRTYERVQAGKTAKGSIARANSGYVFVNWTDEEKNVVSTDSSYIPEKTDPATYTANFKAKESSLIIHYTDDKGNEIKKDDTKQIAFGTEWSVDAPEIKGYKQPSEKTQSGTKKDETEEITFAYTQKEGKVVYNLGPNGSWKNGTPPENVVVFDAAKGKWAYNYGFDKGDTFVVTDSVPTSSDNAVFVGWYDKERGTTPAAMRTAGEKVTYPYTESSKTNSYTLDALWEKLQGANKVLPYDGKEHSLYGFTVKFANDNLQGWTESASSLVQASNIQYRLKQDGKNEWGAMPSFKDAGVYTIEAKATVNGVELKAEATLTISPKNVTLTTEGATRAYNGQPLTAPGTITGFIEGEGAKVVTTKSQTAVGQTSNDEYNIVWNENTTESNYSVKVGEIGKLTVTAQSIDPGTEEKPNPDYKGVKVNSPSDEPYDGKEHKWIPTVTDKADKKLEAGKDYTVEYS
ncbi:Ig-like domain-containing protein, partial [Holdemanella porci]